VKAWVAVLALLIAVGVVVVVLLFLPSTKLAPQPPTVQSRPVKTVTQSPTEVVVAYLQALQSEDYQTAYSHLSRESKRKHPYTEFVSLNEQKGITEYDLGTAREEQGEDGYMTVAVQLREDPALAGFRMVKEGGNWQVVFLGGIPSYPYP